MAKNWWDDAPLAEDKEDDWWKAAPLADAKAVPAAKAPAPPQPGMTSAADQINKPMPSREPLVSRDPLSRPAAPVDPIADAIARGDRGALVRASRRPNVAAEEAQGRETLSNMMPQRISASPERSVVGSLANKTLAKPEQRGLGALALETLGDAGRGVTQASLGLGGSAWGAVQGLADATGADAVSVFAGSSGAIGREASGQMRNPVDEKPFVQDVFRSTFTSLPLAALGRAALPAIAAQAGAAEYSESRARGLSPLEALDRAAYMGVTEMLGELVSIGPLQRVIGAAAGKMTTREFGKTVAELLVKEQVGEQATQAMQSAYEVAGWQGRKRDMTLAEYLTDAAETAKLALGQSLLTAGMGAGMRAAGRRISRAGNEAAQSGITQPPAYYQPQTSSANIAPFEGAEAGPAMTPRERLIASGNLRPAAPPPIVPSEMPTRIMTPDEIDAVAGPPLATAVAPIGADVAPPVAPPVAPGLVDRALDRIVGTERAPLRTENAAIGIERTQQGSIAQQFEAQLAARNAPAIQQPTMQPTAPQGALSAIRDQAPAAAGQAAPQAQGVQGAQGVQALAPDAARAASGPAAADPVARPAAVEGVGVGATPAVQPVEARAWIDRAKETIRSAIGRAKADNRHNDSYTLMPVAPEAAQEASRAGLSIAGFNHAIDGSAIRRTFTNHGNDKTERSRGQLAVTDADIEAIPDLIDAPDKVVYGLKNKAGRDMVVYLKAMPDGSTLSLEEVRTGKKTLTAQSMRRFPQTTSADSIVESLRPASETLPGEGLIVIDRAANQQQAGGTPATGDFDSIAGTLPSNARSDGGDGVSAVRLRPAAPAEAARTTSADSTGEPLRPASETLPSIEPMAGDRAPTPARRMDPASQAIVDQANARSQSGAGNAGMEARIQPAGRKGNEPGTAQSAAEIDAAANEASTSKLNDLPQPKPGQRGAGNSRVGRVTVQGMPVSIENPKGSPRVAKDGSWRVPSMPAHYGYIRGTKAPDGGHVDLFIGDKGDNGKFFVITQNKPDSKVYDEPKVVTGVDSRAEAVKLYKDSFTDGFGDKVFGAISPEMDAATFRSRLPELEANRPLAAATPDVRELKPVSRRVQQALRKDGIKPTSRMDIERAFNDGARVFVYAEQDKAPSEITSIENAANFTPDQVLMLMPQARGASKMGAQQTTTPAGATNDRQATADQSPPDSKQPGRGDVPGRQPPAAQPVGRFDRASRALRLRGEVRALGITDRLQRDDAQALVGLTAKTPDDLAELAQVFRNPAFETFRVFFLKGDEIVHSTGITSRRPGAAPIFPAGMNAKEGAAWIAGQMDASGADGYYLLHNHPSGNPAPSRSDEIVTMMIASDVPGMRAHVIINSGKYSVISSRLDQRTETLDIGKDELLDPSVRLPVLGNTITSPTDLVRIGQSLKRDGYLTVVGTSGSEAAVRVVVDFPRSMLDKSPLRMAAQLRRLQETSGAGRLFLVTDNRADLENQTLRQALSEGIFTDVVADGVSAEQTNLPAGRDSVFDGRGGLQAPGSTAPGPRTPQTQALVDMRRRMSVLRSLSKCLA